MTEHLFRDELIASLALATDLALGHPMEQGLGTCLVATRLAELAGRSAEERERVFSLALLRHIGCTTENDGLARLVGDEIRFSRAVTSLSGSSTAAYVGAALRVALADGGPADKVRATARFAAGLRGWASAGRAICEVARMLASRMGFDGITIDDLGAVYERWDGKGMPNRIRREEIPLVIRITQVADLASALHDLGHEQVVGVVRDRSGSGLDPELVDLFAANADELLDTLDAPSRWEAVRRAGPLPRVELDAELLDESLHAVADFADLKSPFLLGHSSGVARLARAAAERLSLPATDAVDVGRAALVHDLGRVGVSSAVWGKRGPLTAGEWEAVRLHPYHSERILCRAPFLERLSSMASMHHERLDGSGYFRGASGLGPGARVLAAADAYHAMTEPRPHRAAMPPQAAAEALRGEVRAGRLDREAVDAVLEAAGQRVGRRKEHVAGLTAREVEVLRLAARGLSSREIARRLVISPKTVGNHIQAIYMKAGVATRAAATVFAMQHGLLDSLER